MVQKSIKLCVQKAALYILQYVQNPLHHEYKFSTRLLLKTTLIHTRFYIYLYIYSMKKICPPPVRVVGILNCYGLEGPGSNRGVSEIFRTNPEWPRGSLRLLYDGAQRLLPGVKADGAWR